MPQVLVVSGIQAAGKSTVAGLLARRFHRGVHVAGDSIRAMVVSGRVDMAPEAPAGAIRQLLLRYQAAIAVAQLYHDEGFDVVIDDVIIGDMVERFLAMVPWTALRLVFLNPDPEEVARRELGHRKNAYGTVWSVDGLHRVLEEETPRLGMWVDSSRQTPDETVDTILADPDAGLWYSGSG